MTKLILLLFAFLSISPCVFSQNDNNQNNSSSEQIPSRFWKATLPGGEYMVALNSISSIAKHTYIVDGAARVFEVTVADRSSAIARFYFIEPVTDSSPINAGQVVLDRLKRRKFQSRYEIKFNLNHIKTLNKTHIELYRLIQLFHIFILWNIHCSELPQVRCRPLSI